MPKSERSADSCQPGAYANWGRLLHAAGKAGLSQRPYVRAFVETLKDTSFKLLPDVSRL